MKYMPEFKFIFFAVCLIVLFVLINGCASTNWVKAGDTEIGNYYVDKNYTKKNDYGRVMTMELTDYKQPMKEGNVTYKSIAGKFEYDCQNERRRLRHVSAYTGSMATGEIIKSGPAGNNGTWQPVHAGKIDEEILLAVCYVDPNELTKNEKINRALLYYSIIK